ncbi:hypothetical protein ABIF63_005302 [Bradyrhizobium japonicum]|uniref:Transposase n=1 Tax=Bradyrhizobium japonicum TaxID=375 RepID=A0ABV2RWB2_BRAJP
MGKKSHGLKMAEVDEPRGYAARVLGAAIRTNCAT